MCRRKISWSVLGAGLLSLSAGVSAAQEIAATAENILKGFVPRQRDVEFETPKPTEFAKCAVKVERFGKGSGWVVTGPNGQVLRRIVDTDALEHVAERAACRIQPHARAPLPADQ